MDRYVEWLRSNGARFESIQWPVDIPATGRGAIATRDVKPNEPFVVIPSKLIIDPPLCRRAPDVGPFLSAHRVFVDNDELTLAFYICHERLKGKYSFWEPYIDSLPKDTGSIYTWTHEELSELQDPGMVEEATNIGPSERMELYERIRVVLDKAQSPFKQITNSESFTYELFSWAVDTVCCRSFGRRLRYVSLVPLADNLNHGNVQTKYSYDGTNFKLFPTGNNMVQQGSEAFNSYGRRSNANLLFTYGFALETNEWDEINVELRMPKSSACYEEKKKLLLGDWYSARLRRSEIPIGLISFLRLINANENEFHTTMAIGEGGGALSADSAASIFDFVSPENELGALDGACEELETVLMTFPTTEKMDIDLLAKESAKGENSNHKLVFAMRYRIGRKEIIRLNLEYLRKMQSLLRLVVKDAILAPKIQRLQYEALSKQLLHSLSRPPVENVDELANLLAAWKA